jgi:DNA-binding transcriptional regulator GbsR (MarR family)
LLFLLFQITMVDVSPRELQLEYAARVARVWVRRFRVSPIAGRVVGYLLVCDPAWQSIDELAAALRASRSAVAGAVKDLESLGALQRGRAAGDRMDRVRVIIDQARGFDPAPYREAAAFAREGLTLLIDQSAERRKPLEEMASMGDFLAERLPQLLAEWQELQDANPAIGKEVHPGRRSGGHPGKKTRDRRTTGGRLS